MSTAPKSVNTLIKPVEEYLYGCTHMAELAEQIVTADNVRRAELTKTGHYDHTPPAAALLAEVLLGRLAVLRPHLPYVCVAAADNAEAMLTGLVGGDS